MGCIFAPAKKGNPGSLDWHVLSAAARVFIVPGIFLKKNRKGFAGKEKGFYICTRLRIESPCGDKIRSS